MGQLGYSVALHECGHRLLPREANEYSQFGEDGLIAAALAEIGCVNHWCFEVGAADGVFFSNTKALRDDGWDSVLIEADAKQFQELQRFENKQTRVFQERIGPDSLDRILWNANAPQDIDFGVIDIDGQDFWCWAGMQDFRPRLMLVEFEPRDEHDESYFVPKLGGDGQATLEPICDLGRSKGYEPILRTHCNVLFCKRELLWAK